MIFFKTFYGNEGNESSDELTYGDDEYIFSVAEFVNGAPPEYMKDGKYIFSDADEAIFAKIQKADELIDEAFDKTLKFLGKPEDKERILEMVKILEMDENEKFSVSETQRVTFFIWVSDCLKPRKLPLSVTASPEEGKVLPPPQP